MFEIARLVCVPVVPLNIDYLPVENYFDRGFHLMISSRDNWNPDIIIPPELLDICTAGSILDNAIGSVVYSGKPDLNISLRLSDYGSVF